jgi:hypothetical protein
MKTDVGVTTNGGDFFFRYQIGAEGGKVENTVAQMNFIVCDDGITIIKDSDYSLVDSKFPKTKLGDNLSSLINIDDSRFHP